MEYLEWLEHAQLFLEACDREQRLAVQSGRDGVSLRQVVESEIQNEHRRAELAQHLTDGQSPHPAP